MKTKILIGAVIGGLVFAAQTALACGDHSSARETGTFDSSLQQCTLATVEPAVDDAPQRVIVMPLQFVVVRPVVACNPQTADYVSVAPDNPCVTNTMLVQEALSSTEGDSAVCWNA